MTDWKDVGRSTIVGALTGIATGLLAFFFLNLREHQAMGLVLFLLVPVAAGFSIVLVARHPTSTTAAILLAITVSLSFLVFLGKEGVLCALMALPIVVGGMAIGAGIGALLRKYVLNSAAKAGRSTGLLLLVAPTLIFAGERVERPFLGQSRTEVVQSSIQVNATPTQVWDNMLSLDNMQTSKPLLMYVGLPIPQRCTMQGQGVAATRTCYFDVGYIQETVTTWDPPRRLALSIDRTHMPGRHWLSFENADYSLESSGATTMVSRTTVIASRLHPAWYWRPLERLGVESEHNYILREIARRATR